MPNVGEVVVSQETMRAVRLEKEIWVAAPPERVWAAYTVEYGNWWPHRFKTGAVIVCEPRVGGRYYEDWGDGAGGVYGELVYVDPPRALCARGPGGINMAASSMSWIVLEPKDGGTLVKQSLQFWGRIPEEAEQMFAQGLGYMEAVLKPYVERGVTP